MDESSTTEAPRKPLTWCVLLAYGLPSFTWSSVGIMMGLQMSSFYIDRVGLRMSTLALLITLVQLYDCLIALPVGLVSDSCRCRFGRRKPFLPIGKLVMAAFFVAVFTPPRPTRAADGSAVPRPGTVWYAFFAAMLLFTFSAIGRVPWMAWGPQLTPDYEERTKLTTVRELLFGVGCVVATLLPFVVRPFVKDPFNELSWVCTFWAFVMVPVVINTMIQVPDPSSREDGDKHVTSVVGNGREKPRMNIAKILKVWRAMLTTGTVVCLYLTHAVHTAGLNLFMVLFPFFVSNVLKARGVFELIVGLYVVAGAVTTPLWYMAASRWGKKPVFVFSLVIQIFAVYTMGFCSGSGPVFMGLVVGAATVAGTAMVGQNSLKHSMIMDAVSLLKLKQSGTNVEAIVFAIIDTTGKLMSAVALNVSMVAIDRAGYKSGQVGEGDADTEVTQSERAILVLRMFHTWIPGTCVVVCALLIACLYNIDKKRQEEIQKQLAQLEDSIEGGETATSYGWCDESTEPVSPNKGQAVVPEVSINNDRTVVPEVLEF